MESKVTKLHIIAVGNEQQSFTEKTTTRKVVLTVEELPMINPFGHARKPSAPFEIEVYNHNIDELTIGPQLAGEIVTAELIITPWKSGNNQTLLKCTLNDMHFRI